MAILSGRVADRRRRPWVAVEVEDPRERQLTERWGPAGVALWLQYMKACKRSTVEGRVPYLSEAQLAEDLRVLGWQLTDVAGKPFTLGEFFTWTGYRKWTVRHRKSRPAIEYRGWETLQRSRERPNSGPKNVARRGSGTRCQEDPSPIPITPLPDPAQGGPGHPANIAGQRRDQSHRREGREGASQPNPTPIPPTSREPRRSAGMNVGPDSTGTEPHSRGSVPVLESSDRMSASQPLKGAGAPRSGRNEGAAATRQGASATPAPPADGERIVPVSIGIPRVLAALKAEHEARSRQFARDQLADNTAGRSAGADAGLDEGRPAANGYGPPAENLTDGQAEAICRFTEAATGRRPLEPGELEVLIARAVQPDQGKLAQ